MTEFRPYYAFARITQNGYTVEKCYADSPSSWSDTARQAIEKATKENQC